MGGFPVSYIRRPLGNSGRNGGSKPDPDPTAMTTVQLDRAIAAERDYMTARMDVLHQRLDAMDRATELLNADVTRVPTDTDRQIAHLKALHDQRFDSIAQQFNERDTRSERESRDNKVAVDAAFAAQKESAFMQNTSNTLAISKSETATAETINKLAELFRTTTDGLGNNISDLKERISRIENTKQGGKDAIGAVYAFVGFLVSLLILGGLLAITRVG